MTCTNPNECPNPRSHYDRESGTLECDTCPGEPTNAEIMAELKKITSFIDALQTAIESHPMAKMLMKG